MNENNNARVRKRLAMVTAVAVTAAAALLSVASPVALATPKGIFARFAQCPASIPGVSLCEYGEITSGEFVVGSLRVPIDKTIVLQGGGFPTGGPEINEYFMLPAANGEGISPTDLNVPGGLWSVVGCRGIRGRDHFRTLERGWCRGSAHDGASRVSMRIEPAGSASHPAIMNLAHFAFEVPGALTLPVRLHLENPLLGEGCYLGSEAHPIVLSLTDGTTTPPPPNQPISGKYGEAFEEEENEQTMTVVKGNTLLDNAFSVPPAEGCAGHLASIIDPLIDHTLGLESPAGNNTAILAGTHRIAEIPAVLASEKFPTTEKSPPPHHHHPTGHHWWPTR